METINAGSYKMCLIGNTGVGKSTIGQQLKTDGFSVHKPSPTVACNWSRFTYRRGRKKYGLYIWDTSGSPQFRNLLHYYMKDCSIVILVFDITNRESFDSVSDLWSIVSCNTNIRSITLCGNKCDLEQQRMVQQREAEELARTLRPNVPYVEISALNDTNLFTMINSAVEQLPPPVIKPRAVKPDPKPPPVVNPDADPDETVCCCMPRRSKSQNP